jgi:hypothetical protein
MKSILTGAFILGLLLSCASAPAPPAATVVFTTVPVAGHGPTSRGDVAGLVRDLSTPSKFKVVVYAHTDKWYVQPLASDPLTDIASDGAWSTWTHLGNRYAALVVRPEYRPAETLDALPSVGGMIVAKSEVPARE